MGTVSENGRFHIKSIDHEIQSHEVTVLDFQLEAIHVPSPYSSHSLSIELAIHPGKWEGARLEPNMYLRYGSYPPHWYYKRQDDFEMQRLPCLVYWNIDEDCQGEQVHILDGFPDL